MFHKSNLGRFGNNLPCDMHGYVPEEADAPDKFEVDHGSESLVDEWGATTEYGIWWLEVGFPTWKADAISQTASSLADLEVWNNEH